MRITRATLLTLVAVVFLSGCALFAGGQQAAPLPPEEAVRSLPTITPTFEPPSAPSPTPEPQIGRAGPGEILFVREGQVWATVPDGSAERRLTLFEEGVVLRDLAVSPDGHYLAFTVNGQEVAVYDLAGGDITTVDRVDFGGVSSPVWSPGSDVLYYQRIAEQPVETPYPESEIWQASMPPGSPPGVSVANTGAGQAGLTPLFALDVGRLLVGEVQGGELTRSLLYDGGNFIPLRSEDSGDDFGVWDLSPDRSRVLLYKLSEAVPGGQAGSIPLYMAELSPSQGLVNLMQVSPEDDVAVFSSARFAPDGVRVVALRYERPESGELLSIRAQAVLLQPSESAGYQLTTLAPDPAVDTLAFSWHSEAGVVAQRWSPESNIFELWMLPLDGSPGRYLTAGEQPLVVGGR